MYLDQYYFIRMYSFFWRACLSGGLLLAAFFSSALQAAEVNYLESVAYSDDDNIVSLQISDSDVKDVRHFFIDGPPRVVIDMYGVLNNISSPVKFDSDLVDAVEVVESGERTRVILELSKPVPYYVVLKDSDVQVGLDASQPLLSDQEYADILNEPDSVLDVVDTTVADTTAFDADSYDTAVSDADSYDTTASLDAASDVDAFDEPSSDADAFDEPSDEIALDDSLDFEDESVFESDFSSDDVVVADSDGALADAQTDQIAADSQNSQIEADSIIFSEDDTEDLSDNELYSPQTVTDVSFRRGFDGEGLIAFEFLSATPVVKSADNPGKLILDFFDADVVEDLIRRMDVLDFATPVAYVDVFRYGGHVRAIITMSSDLYDGQVFQSGNVITAEVRKHTGDRFSVASGSRANQVKKSYKGDRISLNFQDVSVRAILQILSDFTDINMVVSDNVKGNVTLRLKDVPWDHALDVILQTKNLAKNIQGDVMLIAPTSEIAQYERWALESVKSNESLEQLVVDIVQINYAKVADIAQILTSVPSVSGDVGSSGGGSILSPRGSVAVDSRTNKLLVRDIPSRIDNIRDMIKRFDIPVQQVLINARVVVASDNFSKDLGVRFGVSNLSGSAGSAQVAVSGNSTGVSSLLAGTNPGNGRFNVNYAAASGAASFGLAFAKLPYGRLLELELSAMQAENQGKVVSSPRLITASQQKASIEQGVEIPYSTSNSSGNNAGATTNNNNSTIEFRKAVLSLEVTPQVTPDENVIMDLIVKRDTVGAVFTTGGGDQVPSIDTREVSTQVLVGNNETVVLGGVYEQTTLDTVRKVPFFSDLPLVGSLFRARLNSDNKSELLIFITPTILEQ